MMNTKIFNFLPPDAKIIRTKVFIEEQGFVTEFDELDNAATHLVGYDRDGTPICTCRVFESATHDTYIVGRLAVIKEYRGRGFGAQMLAEAEKHIALAGGKVLSLHAQCRAVDFYSKCGYTSYGEVEYEEFCPHIWMEKLICPRLHNMRLNEVPFDLIEQGLKSIELRLYDEKRRLIKVGDIIRFTHATAPSKTLERRVIALHIFPTFEELYKTLPLEKCGYTKDNISLAHFKDMKAYYSQDEQIKYGVVGIELSKN